MVKQSMHLILMFNFIILIGLVAGLSRWQIKHGRLTPHNFSMLLTGYFSFSFITTMLPLLITNVSVTIIVDIVYLLLLWCFGYPLFRWIYGQFNVPK